MDRAVVLITHGTVDDLADLTPFVTNIRRGHAPPPKLIAELVHRYEAIGGRSPLNETTRRLAAKLEQRLGVPTRMASRLWKPFVKDVLSELGAREVFVIPMAQHSANIYVQAAESAAKELAPSPAIRGIGDWGQTPALLDSFARRILALAAELTPTQRAESVLVLSAHSLPMAVIARGDGYEREVRASAEAVAARVHDSLPDVLIAFQSQGMSQGGGAWLGPDLASTLDAIAARGKKRVIFAPIGFLADHVEILFDLDIEARGWAEQRGLAYSRVPSLNDDDDFVEVLAGLVR